MHESYTLQILTRERLEEWRDFHRINASDFVRERPPEQLEQAAEDNKLVVLDDAEGRIRASCGVFEYGEGSYREVGAVRVLVNGFGLQTAMMAAVVYSDWVYDPPDTSWLAITAKKNNGSIISIERAQFVSTEVLEEARLAAMGMKVLDSGKRHFLFPETNISLIRKQLRKILHDGGILKNGRYLPINLLLPIFTDEHV